jgi:hypothetical protein
LIGCSENAGKKTDINEKITVKHKIENLVIFLYFPALSKKPKNGGK